MNASITSFAKRHGTLIGGVFAVAVVAIVFLVVFPQIASWRDVWNVIRDLSWRWLLALVLAVVANIVVFAFPRMAVIPRLSFRPALTLHLASTASTFVLPGGAFLGFGLSFAMLKAWGYEARTVAVGLSVMSILNQFFIFGAPPIAFALLTTEGGQHALLNTFVWIGLAVVVVLGTGFGASLYSSSLAQRFGDLLAALASRALGLIRRGPVRWDGGSFVRFRADALGLLRSRWHVIILTTLIAQLSIFLVLIVAIRAVGISSDQVSLFEAFTAWSLIRVLASIPIMPGGLGVIELGLTALFVGFGADNADAVAAVILYRVLTTGSLLVLGAGSVATWRRQHPGWQDEAEMVAPT
jgi:uncharacterized membrane protein YbhN (UPF0104 family)